MILSCSLLPSLFSQWVVELTKLFHEISNAHLECHVEFILDNFHTTSFSTNTRDIFPQSSILREYLSFLFVKVPIRRLKVVGWIC